MEKQDILDILDSLDLQISMGKIDQNTYNGLRQKWMQKLQSVETGVITDTTGQPSRPTTGGIPGQLSSSVGQPQMIKAEALACPKCAAPAEIDSVSQDLTKPIQCLFCDTVYTLRQSQDDAQRLKQELKAWLDQMIVGSGYTSSGSNSIDVNARRFIFAESLYPSLKKEIDRRLESLEYAPEAPMIPMQVMLGFHDYRPNPFLIAIGQGNNQWLKTLATRVSAQQLQDFAAIPDDKLKLKTLQFRILSLIYYANIAHHLAIPGDSSYQVVRQNLLALQKDYREHMQEVVDEAYRSYIVALDTRIQGDILLLDVLISSLEKERGVSSEATLNQVERAMIQLSKAEQQAFACTYNPLYTVPLQQGIQRDLLIARVFYAALKCYEMVSRTQSVEFKPFFEHLNGYIRSLVNIQSPDELLGLFQGIGHLLAARSGDNPIPIVMDWSWLDTVIEGNRRKSTFGGSETVDTILRHFHPYWVATLSYAEKSGFISKSATGRESLILADATSTGAPIIGHVLVNDPSLSIIQTGMNNFNLLDKQLVALPALISRNMAEKAMKAYTSRQAAELGATNIKMLGLIYLPAAFVRYIGKKENRELVIGRLPFVNQTLGNALLQTQQFLQQYAV